jgi:hypothetical protein
LNARFIVSRICFNALLIVSRFCNVFRQFIFTNKNSYKYIFYCLALCNHLASLHNFHFHFLSSFLSFYLDSFSPSPLFSKLLSIHFVTYFRLNLLNISFTCFAIFCKKSHQPEHRKHELTCNFVSESQKKSL